MVFISQLKLRKLNCQYYFGIYYLIRSYIMEKPHLWFITGWG